MSRRTHSLVVLFLAVFALAAAACADSTAPAGPKLNAQTCDWTSSGTCH